MIQTAKAQENWGEHSCAELLTLSLCSPPCCFLMPALIPPAEGLDIYSENKHRQLEHPSRGGAFWLQQGLGLKDLACSSKKITTRGLSGNKSEFTE